jgi:hypothetical protein
MQNTAPGPRESWRALTVEEKQRRLEQLRREQQRQIELEVRRLDASR